MKKKIVYVDMDNVLANYRLMYNLSRQLNPKNEFPQCEYGFYAKLPLIEHAKIGLDWLYKDPRYDVYILTAPSVKNPLSYTEKRVWVEENFGMEMVDRLIITPNKGLSKGDYLIDDNISGRGQENFEGKIIHFGSRKYFGWLPIIEYFGEHWKE